MTVDGSSKKALVVDDDLSTRLLLETVLQKLSFEVALAQDGAEALDRSAEEHYNVTFLDLRMPGVDGIEFLSRNTHRPEHLIVFSGAKEAASVLPDGSYCGIVEKPFDLDALLSQLHDCMDGHPRTPTSRAG